MRIELPQPHVNQQAILNSTARFNVVMCGRRFGKSEVSQIRIITKALHGRKVAYITPTYNLAKRFFSRLSARLPFPANKSDLIIEFPTGGQIEFFTGERLDNLRGRKFHHVVVDEASFIPDLEHGWQNSIRPTLTDYEGGADFLSTPRGKNYFYSLFMKAEGDPDWQAFKFTTYDNPHISKDEIDAARRELPDPVFRQEYLADPMENAANPFGIDHIRACLGPLSTEGTAFYGIDLAKSIDYTVIIGLDSKGRVSYFDRFKKDWLQTKETILRLDRLRPVYIDSTGVGDAITEDLQRSFPNMTGYKYTSTTKQQLMELLAAKIHAHDIRFPDGMIVSELEIFEYEFTATGVRYNAPQGFHDDCVNALALAVRCREAQRDRGVYHFI